MIRTRSLAGLVLIAAACTGLTLAADNFDEITPAFARAYTAGDAKAVAALYAEDAHIMPPGSPAASGKSAILAFLEKDVAGAKGLTLELVTGATSKNGDVGFARGTWAMKDPSGKVVDRGSWMEMRRKVGGRWVIQNDIWNSDQPPAGK